MQPLHKRPHRRIQHLPLLIWLRNSIIEHTLQPKLHHPFLLLDIRRHFEQAIASPHIFYLGRVSTAHDDGVLGFGDDFEVVCYLRAYVVGAGLEVLFVPELGGGFWAAVF